MIWMSKSRLCLVWIPTLTNLYQAIVLCKSTSRQSCNCTTSQLIIQFLRRIWRNKRGIISALESSLRYFTALWSLTCINMTEVLSLTPDMIKKSTILSHLKWCSGREIRAGMTLTPKCFKKLKNCTNLDTRGANPIFLVGYKTNKFKQMTREMNFYPSTCLWMQRTRIVVTLTTFF